MNVRDHSRNLLVATLILVGVGMVASILQLYREADKSRLVQIEAWRVQAHAQEISRIEWEAMARHGISAESLREFEHVRLQMVQGASFVKDQDQKSNPSHEFKLYSDQYVDAVSRQLSFVRSGEFDKARILDESETDAIFSKLRLMTEELNDQYSQTAERVATTTRVGLMIAAVLSVGVALLLLHRLEVQRHKTELNLTEENALRRSEERFRALTNNAAGIVVVMDQEGVVTYVSSSVHKLLGLDEQDLIGRKLCDRVHCNDAAQLDAVLAAVASGHGEPTIECRIRHADKTWRIFECSLRSLLDDPNVAGLLLNARDITLRKHAQDQLAFNASHDALTGLPNRALFAARLQAAVERRQRHPDLVNAVLFIDIDDFKVVNDALGHDMGDQLIAAFAERLSNSLRREDVLARSKAYPDRGEAQTVARLGGDEFTVLLEDLSDPSDAIRVAQRIQDSLAKPFILAGQEVFKSASIGIAFTSVDTSAETITAHADIAMYRAKNNGKSRCEIFDDAMHAQVTTRLDLETALRRGIDRGEFSLFYQPIVSLTSGTVLGFEALLRWQRPEVGMLSPDSFIPVAEATGLIVPLGQWVLNEACREAASWCRLHDGEPLFVSVNVSGRQFSHPAFVEQVREALIRHRVEPSAVTLEVTETAAMEDPVRCERTMHQLRAIGVQLSIDDFGTGYSSLSSLRRYPLNTLKIDRSFVSTLNEDPQSYAIVKTIIALARNLGMKVVAEGIENVQQLEKLQAGCDSGQGYLFSEPIRGDSVWSFLASRSKKLLAASATASGISPVGR